MTIMNCSIGSSSLYKLAFVITFVGPSLSPRGEKKPKTRPLSLVSYCTTKKTSFLFCFGGLVYIYPYSFYRVLMVKVVL